MRPATPIPPIFITGIGTGVGKTLVAAIVTEALQADYWKPVQAGYSEGTDSGWVQGVLSNPHSRIHPETYRLALPASPHIAARQEGVVISIPRIAGDLRDILAASGLSHAHSASISLSEPARDQSAAISQASPARPLVIEGAGGLLVPLNEKEFVPDLIRELGATLILVSRNYLGSINHSLLTAEAARAHGLNVAGWIFNDQYGHYEEDIVRWTGIPALASIPYSAGPGREFVREQAQKIAMPLRAALIPGNLH
ncbi:MAG TPA: ATP-dependent dethiobiotin synthetase BioD [Puia sp.]|nr:ATP-dependent dethiobiotin synthetase BioD [Puia sp.]